MKVDIKYTKLFINNEWLDSVSKKTFPTINPQNETVITHVAEGDKDDVDLAVSGAIKAFHRYSAWRTLDASERGRLLLKLADLIERDIKYLSKLETLDCGKPIKNAESDIFRAVHILRYYADGEVLSFTLKEPVGVCGIIIPWNYPIPMFVWKIAPALAAGCTTIVKPAEQTPLTALALAALIKEAGFPPGVVNVIPGFGPTAGSAITNHPNIDKVALTGSTEVGRIVMTTAAINIKRVTLELGGKSPLIIFNDTDVENAAKIAHNATFANGGQCCVAATRIYVQSGIYDEFVERAAKIARKRTVGDPYLDVQQGPQIDKNMFEKVMSYIASGKESGAKCIVGGERIGEVGYYIQPTVFVDVEDDMKIAKEEIFGPVQCIFKFHTFEEVLDRANKSNYGLGAGFITTDIMTALAFAKHARAGSTWINTYLHIAPQTPFGGYKESGFGRELGEDGILQYLENKTVTISLPKTPPM